MFRNKTCLFAVLGGMFRFWQGQTVSYYTLQYFGLFGNKNLFSILYALSVLIGGFSSQLIAGYISDKYEKANFRTKAHVCTVMSLCSAICGALTFLLDFSFAFCMCFLFLMFLLGEGWMPPALAMIQTTIDVRYKAVSMAVFLCLTGISGMCGTFLAGEIETLFDIDTTEESSQDGIGYVIALNTVIPSLIAAIFFYVCGFYYEAHMIEVTKEVDDALEKATQYTFDGRKDSVRSYGSYRFNSISRKYEFSQGANLTVVKEKQNSVYQKLHNSEDNEINRLSSSRKEKNMTVDVKSSGGLSNFG